MMLSWKLGPALAAGNCVILKPSEFTPLTALFTAKLVHEAGFPPGVVNVVNGYGARVGNAIAVHPNIEKVAFTGSTLVGRKILEAAARTNLKDTTLELGGKSPNIIFDDCDIEQALDWTIHGILYVSYLPSLLVQMLIQSILAGTTDRLAALALVSSFTRRSTTSSWPSSPRGRSRSSSATPSTPPSTRVPRFPSSSSTYVYPLTRHFNVDTYSIPSIAYHGVYRLRQGARCHRPPWW